MEHQELEQFVIDNNGVVSVSELASFLDLEEGEVRRWARERDVRRLGSVFAFDLSKAKELAQDLEIADEDDGDEDEDEDDDESDDA